MNGASSSFAEIALPPLHDVLVFAAPVLVLGALTLLIARTDRIVHSVFPDLEWERNLGWLNIRAERRADRGIRWVGYGVIVLLLDALVGILWAAKGLPRLADWSDPWVMGVLALRVPAGALCLLIWVIYLGLGLLPRLRAENETKAFRKFRAEIAAADEEKRALEAMGGATSRTHAELPKPRANSKPVTLTPRRHWRQHPPGG
jgi:hypothetical protein